MELNNSLSSTDSSIQSENSRPNEVVRPTWQRPSVSLLEIEAATLTGAAGFVEFGFSS